MHIDHYSFGRIGIDGRDYDADVIVFPDHVQGHWRRREGHHLAIEDLETVLADPPQMLIVGTGCYGRMQIPGETLERLREAGVEVRIATTGHTVADLNRLQQECPRIVAGLHLTC